ncbi:MAG: hypothetical protein WCK51_02455 [Armatimonadota bacterium]
MKFGITGIGITVLSSTLAGCAGGDAEDVPVVPVVSVPASLDHPREVVGLWKSSKGDKSMELKEDGTAVSKSRVKVGGKDSDRTMDVSSSVKWGTAGDKWFFYGHPSLPAVVLTWKLSSGSLIHTQGRFSQAYVKTSD